MDTGEGRFIHKDTLKELEEIKPFFKKAGGIFSVGEKIELKDSIFRVRKITKKDLILRLEARG